MTITKTRSGRLALAAFAAIVAMAALTLSAGGASAAAPMEIRLPGSLTLTQAIGAIADNGTIVISGQVTGNATVDGKAIRIRGENNASITAGSDFALSITGNASVELSGTLAFDSGGIYALLGRNSTLVIADGANITARSSGRTLKGMGGYGVLLSNCKTDINGTLDANGVGFGVGLLGGSLAVNPGGTLIASGGLAGLGPGGVAHVSIAGDAQLRGTEAGGAGLRVTEATENNGIAVHSTLTMDVTGSLHAKGDYGFYAKNSDLSARILGAGILEIVAGVSAHGGEDPWKIDVYFEKGDTQVSRWEPPAWLIDELYRNGRVTTSEPGTPGVERFWCPKHNCLNRVCGGPHAK